MNLKVLALIPVALLIGMCSTACDFSSGARVLQADAEAVKKERLPYSWVDVADYYPGDYYLHDEQEYIDFFADCETDYATKVKSWASVWDNDSSLPLITFSSNPMFAVMESLHFDNVGSVENPSIAVTSVSYRVFELSRLTSGSLLYVPEIAPLYFENWVSWSTARMAVSVGSLSPLEMFDVSGGSYSLDAFGNWLLSSSWDYVENHDTQDYYALTLDLNDTVLNNWFFDILYNDFIASGYNAFGDYDAYARGYDIGEDNGLSVGYSSGYSAGYTAGVNSVTDSTTGFNTLVAAIAGVPWNIFDGLGGLTIWRTPIISILFTFVAAGVLFYVLKKFVKL